MKVFLGRKASAKAAGIVVKQDTTYMVPILHPMHIQRGQWNQAPVQEIYLKRVKRIIDGEEWPILDPKKPPPNTILHPTLEDLKQWESMIDSQGITVDVEAAGRHITIVGLCRIADLVPIVVRFRKKGGGLYWSSDQLPSVVEWLDQVFQNQSYPKVMHNGQAYDLPQLERTGFRMERYEWDTMLAQYILFPELPKDLEFVSNVFSGIGGWKWLVGEQEGEGK
jgi:hypothetical protein